MIPAVTADYCSSCDESITDMAETERVMREMQAFNKQVNTAAERLRGRIRLADSQVQEEPFFITEEIEAEMIAAGYVFEPPAHVTITNARDLFGIQEDETVAEAIARYCAKVG